MIKLDAICRTYASDEVETTALDHIDLHVERGDTILFLARGDGAIGEAKRDIFGDRQFVDQVEALEHEAQPVAAQLRARVIQKQAGCSPRCNASFAEHENAVDGGRA